MDEDEQLLGSIYELLKLSNSKVTEGFATDNSRAPSWGPNSSTNKLRQQKEQTEYVTNTTTNKRQNYLTQFSKFNTLMEGDRGAFYSPGKGTSGWTIGQGIDISQMSRDEVIGLGLPDEMVAIADKYEAWGVEGKKVPREVQKMSFDMNTDAWKEFGENVAATKLPLMEKIERDNPQLSTRGVVALAQADHWSGGLYSRPRSASKFNRSTMSLTSGGKRTSATKDLQNPLALLLESGAATDGGVREVFGLIQKSYGTGRPLNSTTLGRYMNYLDTGN